MPPAARKTEQNEELPLTPIEPKPKSPDDLIFKIRVYPVIFQGNYNWRWELLHHTHVPHVGDFTAVKDADSYGTAELAEEAARRHVAKVRHVAGLKLAQPADYIIEI